MIKTNVPPIKSQGIKTKLVPWIRIGWHTLECRNQKKLKGGQICNRLADEA